jgi:hypothetical protein
MMMVMMMVVMMTARAVSVLVIFMMVMMLMFIMAAFAVMVMMLVVVMAAFAVMVMMLVVVMAALTVMVMMLVVVMAAFTVMVVMLVVVMAALTVVVVMLVMMMRVLLKLLDILCQGVFLLHRLYQLLARKQAPLRSNYNRFGIMISQKRYTFIDLLFGYFCRVTQNDTTRVFNLIIEKLAKILHVHFALVGIYHRSKSIKHRAMSIGVFNRAYYVGELTHTGRLDKNSVGSIFAYHLLKRRGKISHQ